MKPAKPKMKELKIQLEERDRAQLDILTEEWGCSLGAAIRRLVRESRATMAKEAGK